MAVVSLDEPPKAKTLSHVDEVNPPHRKAVIDLHYPERNADYRVSIHQQPEQRLRWNMAYMTPLDFGLGKLPRRLSRIHQELEILRSRPAMENGYRDMKALGCTFVRSQSRSVFCPTKRKSG